MGGEQSRARGPARRAAGPCCQCRPPRRIAMPTHQRTAWFGDGPARCGSGSAPHWNPRRPTRRRGRACGRLGGLQRQSAPGDGMGHRVTAAAATRPHWGPGQPWQGFTSAALPSLGWPALQVMLRMLLRHRFKGPPSGPPDALAGAASAPGCLPQLCAGLGGQHLAGPADRSPTRPAGPPGRRWRDRPGGAAGRTGTDFRPRAPGHRLLSASQSESRRQEPRTGRQSRLVSRPKQAGQTVYKHPGQLSLTLLLMCGSCCCRHHCKSLSVHWYKNTLRSTPQRPRTLRRRPAAA